MAGKGAAAVQGGAGRLSWTLKSRKMLGAEACVVKAAGVVISEHSKMLDLKLEGSWRI